MVAAIAVVTVVLVKYLFKIKIPQINGSQLTGKNEKGIFLTCPCHKIYRVDAVGLSISNYT